MRGSVPRKGKEKGKEKATDEKGKSKGKGKDKGQGKGGVVRWTCQKVGRRSSECPMNKTVSFVGEEEKSNEEGAEVTLDAGGVFWVNAVGKEGPEECNGRCEEFKRPKKDSSGGRSLEERISSGRSLDQSV